MFDTVFKKYDGERRYHVYVDHDNLHDCLYNNKRAFDFGDEQANQEYSQAFAQDEICSFGVEALEVCQCCCQWSVKDSLWGIHAETPEKALEEFLRN